MGAVPYAVRKRLEALASRGLVAGSASAHPAAAGRTKGPALADPWRITEEGRAEVELEAGVASAPYEREVVGGEEEEDLRLNLAQEARDAMPIMNSGAGPAVFLALGALGWLPPGLSQVLGVAYVVVRLAGTGIIVRRVSGPSSGLGGVSLVIAALKNIITH